MELFSKKHKFNLSPDYAAGIEQGKITAQAEIAQLTTQLQSARANLSAETHRTSTDMDTAIKQAVEAATIAERQRISAILNHEHAKGREAQAKIFALESDIPPEQALKLLAASPILPTPKAEGLTEFQKYMASIKNPKIGMSLYDEEPDHNAHSNTLAGLAKGKF